MSESPTASSKPSPSHGAFRLSEELVKLEEKSRERSINLGDVIFLLHDRARPVQFESAGSKHRALKAELDRQRAKEHTGQQEKIYER